MRIDEKLELLEEILESDAGSLEADLKLDNIEEWDSMAQISLMALMDDKFGKKVTGEVIRSLKTVGDILQLME